MNTNLIRKSTSVITVILSILIGASNAVAGTPDEDIFIKKLRDDFSNAKTPTETQLRLKNKWICLIRSAIKGYNTVLGPGYYLSLKKYGSLYMDVDPRLDENGKISPTTGFGIFQSGEFLYSESGDPTMITVIRVTDTGDLILEESTSTPVKATIPSEAIPSNKATKYITCPSADILMRPVPVPLPSIEAVSAACDKAMTGHGDEFYDNQFYHGKCIQMMAQPDLILKCNMLNPGAHETAYFPRSHESLVLECIRESMNN